MIDAIFDKGKQVTWWVNKHGEVWSIGKKGEKSIKKGTFHKRGYVYVRTTNGNYQLHRLVASAFIPNPQNKPCVNHKDGNPRNNSADNLEWVTHKENTAHAIRNGLMVPPKKNEGPIKYTNEQCAKVLERILSGMTYKKAGEIFKMPYSTVAHLARGSRREI